MRIARSALALAPAVLALLGAPAAPHAAEVALPCGHFTHEAVAVPAPRDNPVPLRRAAQVGAQIRSLPHRVLFLGDSLTERWDPRLWEAHMAPRTVLNAGVSGDRTEHLLWRLGHGNLAGPPPQVVVVLIGTNDLGHGRPPEVAAEGIRAVLAVLRERLPQSRILLLGLLPRGEAPDDRLRRATVTVNAMIEKCGDNSAVFYADIGAVLLDTRGHLSRAVAPDQLHFSAEGYGRLAGPLDRLIDALLARR